VVAAVSKCSFVEMIWTVRAVPSLPRPPLLHQMAFRGHACGDIAAEEVLSKRLPPAIGTCTRNAWEAEQPSSAEVRKQLRRQEYQVRGPLTPNGVELRLVRDIVTAVL
jgi:hypothetical protein